MRIRVYPNCIPRCKVTQKLLDARFENSSILNELDRYGKYFQNLSELLQEGEIIALRKEETAVDVIGFRGTSMSEMYYMQLGSGNERLRLRGEMYLSDVGYGTVRLDDWYVVEENRGYGSFFLSTVITYLKRKGYRRLIGRIEPVDFNHEDKLRHIYGKAGFEIVDRGDHRSLCCHFQSDPSPADKRLDVSQWLQVLEGLSHSDLAERLKLTKQQFEHISKNVLFQEDLLNAATEIGKKYLVYGQYMI